MSVSSIPSHRRLLGWLAGALALLLLVLLIRRPLASLALGSALRLAGTGEAGFQVEEVSPWRLELSNLGFRVRTQPFTARHVTLERLHWWSPSFGLVRVEGLRLAVAIDGSDIDPWAWSSYHTDKQAITATNAVRLPFEQLQVQGQVVLTAAAMADRPVDVLLAFKRLSGSAWRADLGATAPGLQLQAEGHYEPIGDRLDYRVTTASLDLQTWQEVVRRQVLLPGGPWELAGRLAGTATGHYAEKSRGATGQVVVSDGRLNNPVRHVSMEGIAADLEFTDLLRLRSRPGRIRARELRSGDFLLSDLDLTIAFEGADLLRVTQAEMTAFGGRLSVNAFKFLPAQQEIEAVIVASGLDIEQLLAATRDVPARASGRVDGRLPFRLDNSGVRLLQGWLQLRPGEQASLRFHAPGALTSGRAPVGAQYTELRKLEAGQLALRANELRLDLRPPGGALGRTATLHLVGEAVGGSEHDPLTLDLDFATPLEQFISFGTANGQQLPSGH